MSADIFISYSSKDGDFVRKMVRDIEKNGIQCWMSARDIAPGADYQSAIVDAMESAAAVLLVFSENANASKEIVKELALASQKGKSVIPARIKDILPRGAFEYQITNAQFIDLFDNYNGAIVRLCQSLQAQIDIATKGETQIKPGPAYSASRTSRRPMVVGSVAGLALLAGLGGFLAYKPSSSVPTKPAQDAVQAPHSAPEVVPAEHSAPERLASSAPNGTPAPVVPAPRAEATPAPVPPTVPAPPQNQPMPLPEQSGVGVPEAALDNVMKADANGARYQALEDTLRGSDQQLSWQQAAHVLRGASGLQRAELVKLVAKHVATPIPVPVALNFLQFTDNGRPQAISALSSRLPDDITAGDAVALLGNLDGGQRHDSIDPVMEHVQTPLTADEALGILHNTDNFWVGSLSRIKGKLVTPMPGPDCVKLLGRTSSGARHDALAEIVGVLPDTIAPQDAVEMLKNLENFKVGGIALIAGHLPQDMSVPDAVSILAGLSGGARHDGLASIASHIKQGLTGTDVLPLLAHTDNFDVNSLSLIRPVLAQPQDSSSILALLGSLSGGERSDALNILKSYLPDGITGEDAQKILHNTNNFYAGCLDIIAPRLAPLSAADIAALTAPMAGTPDAASWTRKLSQRG